MTLGKFNEKYIDYFSRENFWNLGSIGSLDLRAISQDGLSQLAKSIDTFELDKASKSTARWETRAYSECHALPSRTVLRPRVRMRVVLWVGMTGGKATKPFEKWWAHTFCHL